MITPLRTILQHYHERGYPNVSRLPFRKVFDRDGELSVQYDFLISAEGKNGAPNILATCEFWDGDESRRRTQVFREFMNRDLELELCLNAGDHPLYRGAWWGLHTFKDHELEHFVLADDFDVPPDAYRDFFVLEYRSRITSPREPQGRAALTPRQKTWWSWLGFRSCKESSI